MNEAVNDPDEQDIIAWEYDIPLLTNRFMLYEYVKVTVLTVLIMYALLGLMGVVVEGELIILPPIVGLVTGGVLLALMLAASLFMGNRSHALFAISDQGVAYETGGRESSLARVTAVLGALSGSATTTGAGLMAVARDSEYLAWDDIHRVSYYPGQRVISLKNSWRVVLRLHVPSALWDQVSATVKERHGTVAATRGATAPTSAAFRIAWAIAAVLLTIGAHVWPCSESLLAVRAGVLGGLLIAVSGLAEGPLRRVTALAGSVAVLTHAVGLFFSEIDAPTDLLTIEHVSDGPRFALALTCAVVLVVMGVWRGVGCTLRGDAR